MLRVLGSTGPLVVVGAIEHSPGADVVKVIGSIWKRLLNSYVLPRSGVSVSVAGGACAISVIEK